MSQNLTETYGSLRNFGTRLQVCSGLNTKRP